MVSAVKDGKQTTLGNHGCYSETYIEYGGSRMVRDGVKEDGTYNMVEVPFRMENGCMYDLYLSDPRCTGCKRLKGHKHEPLGPRSMA